VIRFSSLSILLCLLPLLSALTFTARLAGTVLDPAGAPVAGATISATQVETNATKSSTTDAAGVYAIPILPPGLYEVSVTAAGFQKKIQKQVSLEINQSAVLDFNLSLLSVAIEIQVTEEAPVLKTEAGNVGTTISSQTIDELPLVQRDVMAVVRLAPGVIAKGQVGDARGGSLPLRWAAKRKNPVHSVTYSACGNQYAASTSRERASSGPQFYYRCQYTVPLPGLERSRGWAL
jgi:hypothetical protein